MEHTYAPSELVDVFGPDFKYSMDVPVSVVSHFPPARLNITRLVVCRNYDYTHPSTSCALGPNCKFVHIDVDTATLPRHSIHVNYSWRDLSIVTYDRLPAGDVLSVLAPNNRPPLEHIRSELVLRTHGSEHWRDHEGPVSHCAHYHFNRMCNRGERCNFVHMVHVDPSLKEDFVRAPPSHHRVNAKNNQQQQQNQNQHQRVSSVVIVDAALAAPINTQSPAKQQRSTALSSESSSLNSSLRRSASAVSLLDPLRETISLVLPPTTSKVLLSPTTARSGSLSGSSSGLHYYRHNPYSLREVTVRCG